MKHLSTLEKQTWHPLSQFSYVHSECTQLPLEDTVRCTGNIHATSLRRALGKTTRACHWPALVGRPISLSCDARGPAMPIKPVWWAADWPGLLNYHLMGRGPARLIDVSVKKIMAQPVSSDFQICRPGPDRPTTSAARPIRNDSMRAGLPFLWTGPWI